MTSSNILGLAFIGKFLNTNRKWILLILLGPIHSLKFDFNSPVVKLLFSRWG